MITFRQGKQIIQDLMPEALQYLEDNDVRPNLIKPEDADDVAKANSRAIVLLEFIKNENGYYQIKLQSKQYYRWTEKMISDIFKMRILNIDHKKGTITAETNYKGIALEVIEILGKNKKKYNLSIVLV
jgi:ketopantoate reductase